MVGGESRGRWHDGRVRLAALLVPVMLLSAPPADASAASPARSVDAHLGGPQATAPPDDDQVTECNSSLPPPQCGRRDGDGAQVLTFAILVLGMAFIGWRIARGVRRRDRTMSPDP